MFCENAPGVAAADDQHADDVLAASERRHQARAIAGAQHNLIELVMGGILQIGDLDRLGLPEGERYVRLVQADVLASQCVDQLLIHAVSGPQVKLALRLVEHIDRAGFGAGELHRLGDDGLTARFAGQAWN